MKLKASYADLIDLTDSSEDFLPTAASKRSLSRNSSSSNYVITKVVDIEIGKREIDSLSGHNCLNDAIIEAFMKTFCDGKKVFVLSVVLATKIYEHGSINKLRRNFTGYQYVAGPVFIKNSGPKLNHWNLLFVSLETNEVTFIDPFEASKDKCEKVRLNWTNFCKTRDDLKEKTWTISKYSFDHSKQIDGYSCGVFVCYFFEQLVTNKPELLKQIGPLDKYRNYIKSKIMKCKEL